MKRAQPALVDFCLKARQCDFRCVAMAGTGFAVRILVPESSAESDWRRLGLKWAIYPELLEVEQLQTRRANPTADRQ